MVNPALTASLVVATLAALANSPTPASERIEVAELTVESVQEGLRSHRFTARQLAEASLARIATYNPGYNAIITPNPDALRAGARTAPGRTGR
jgi:Asp-tRNA(Asn)/Glu-tRNA(Gln) amidotransferase A subunit family amidase